MNKVLPSQQCLFFVYKMIRCIILKLIFYWQQKFLKNVFLSVKIVISTLFRNLSDMFLHVLYMRNIGEELRQLLEWKFSLIFLFLMFLSIPLLHSSPEKTENKWDTAVEYKLLIYGRWLIEFHERLNRNFWEFSYSHGAPFILKSCAHLISSGSNFQCNMYAKIKLLFWFMVNSYTNFF